MLLVLFRIAAIFLMIGAGWLARRRDWIRPETIQDLSRLLISLFYPALILTTLTRNFTVDRLLANWPLPVGAFAVMVTGFGIGRICSRYFVTTGSRKARTFLFQCTMNNYGFVPLPLALVFWGETAAAALIFSTLGPEIVVWTFGVYALTGRRLDRSSLRHLANPPLFAVAASLVLIGVREWVPGVNTGLGHPVIQEAVAAITASATLLGGATIPVAMLIAGSRMAGLHPAHLFRPAELAVSAVRLVLVPGIAAAVLFLLPLDVQTRRILLLVAVMPCAVSSVLMSERYGADSEFAASSVLVTHLFCLLTIPLWLLLLP